MLIFFGYLFYNIYNFNTAEQWTPLISFLVIPILGIGNLFDA